VVLRSIILWFLSAPLLLFAGEGPRAAGVPNFHQVDEHVFRGAQPTPEGFKNLTKLGVKTVIDLRGGNDHTAGEKTVVETLGMKYVHVPMKGLTAPTDEQVARVLALLDQPSASTDWPVFVHCKRGRDRTGTVIACYRITHDHWDNQKALREARLLGMSWVERSMQAYILSYKPPSRAQVANRTPEIRPARAQ